MAIKLAKIKVPSSKLSKKKVSTTLFATFYDRFTISYQDIDLAAISRKPHAGGVKLNFSDVQNSVSDSNLILWVLNTICLKF